MTVETAVLTPALEERLAFETMLSDLSSRFVNLEPSEVDHEIEERLKLAADAAEVGMWMLDVEGGRFWATERARQIFGYSPETDVTFDRFLESVQPDCREPVTEAVRGAVEDGREVDIEYRILHPDGSERWIHSRGRMQRLGLDPKRLRKKRLST